MENQVQQGSPPATPRWPQVSCAGSKSYSLNGKQSRQLVKLAVPATAGGGAAAAAVAH
jgi:hypothetical protein